MTLENIKKLKETLDKHKAKYDERWEKMGGIRDNDPETNSWEYFQMPDSEDNVDKLRALLSGAIFEKETYDGIAKRFNPAAITEDRQPLRFHPGCKEGRAGKILIKSGYAFFGEIIGGQPGVLRADEIPVTA